MAGHSKWANIKHRKAAQDKKRGKQFASSSARSSPPRVRPVPPIRRQPVARARGAEGEGRRRPQGQHRAGVQARRRRTRRGGGLRGGPVRGLRAGRCRRARRMPHRQPQPHGVGRAQRVRAAGGSLAEPGSVVVPLQPPRQVVVDAPAVEDDAADGGLDAGSRTSSPRRATTSPGATRATSSPCARRSRPQGSPSSSPGARWCRRRPSRSATSARPARSCACSTHLDDNDDVQEVHSNVEIDDDVLAELD
jgi:hypothetical protein